MKFKKSDQSLFRMDENRNQLTQVHLENQHVHVIQCIYVYVLNSVTISPQWYLHEQDEATHQKTALSGSLATQNLDSQWLIQ